MSFTFNPFAEHTSLQTENLVGRTNSFEIDVSFPCEP